MAETYIPSALTVTQWDENYFREYFNQNWFKKFFGTGTNSVIQVKEDLTKKPGDNITLTLVNRLTGEAKSASETLEGNEEDLSTRSFNIRVREYSHAVKFRSEEHTSELQSPM